MMRRLVTALIIAIGMLAGCSRDEHLLTEIDRNRLEILRAEPKFEVDPESFYPGAPNEAIRTRCGSAVDRLIDRLLAQTSREISQDQVLDDFAATIRQFEMEDSEERDRLGLYLEEIMDAVGMESSGGLLNRWRYGFDPRDL